MILLDPHIHSVYSGDAKGSPREIIKKAISTGLDAIAITDHDTLKGSIIAKKEAKDFKDILVIPAIEISTSRGHIIALGVEEEIKKDISPHEAIDQIHEQAALAIIPHPFVKYREGLLVNMKELKMDAIETLNSRYILGYSNWRAKKFAEKKNMPQLGASDAHFPEAIGSCKTKVNSDNNIDEIFSAIKKGETIPLGGRAPLLTILKEVINKKIRRIY